MSQQFLDGVAHDLPMLFNEHGQMGEYTPAGGVVRDVLCILGQRTVTADFENIRADGLATWARFIKGDVPELAGGDLLTVGTSDFVVDGVELDRAGTVLATLIHDT